MATRPIVNARGLVRSVTPRAKRGTGEVFGSEINLLTEPVGGELTVMAWLRDLSVPNAEALVGQNVEIEIDLSASVGSRGTGAFIDATYRKHTLAESTTKAKTAA